VEKNSIWPVKRAPRTGQLEQELSRPAVSTTTGTAGHSASQSQLDRRHTAGSGTRKTSERKDDVLPQTYLIVEGRSIWPIEQSLGRADERNWSRALHHRKCYSRSRVQPFDVAPQPLPSARVQPPACPAIRCSIVNPVPATAASTGCKNPVVHRDQNDDRDRVKDIEELQGWFLSPRECLLRSSSLASNCHLAIDPVHDGEKEDGNMRVTIRTSSICYLESSRLGGRPVQKSGSGRRLCLSHRPVSHL
jgi:hypothetical protein